MNRNKLIFTVVLLILTLLPVSGQSSQIVESGNCIVELNNPILDISGTNVLRSTLPIQITFPTSEIPLLVDGRAALDENGRMLRTTVQTPPTQYVEEGGVHFVGVPSGATSISCDLVFADGSRDTRAADFTFPLPEKQWVPMDA